jgi:hypothetical protein
VIKLNKIRLAEHVARMGDKRGSNTALVRESDQKKPLEEARLKWKDNNKMDLQQFERERMECIDLAWYMDSWRALLNAAMNMWVPYNAGNFLNS